MSNVLNDRVRQCLERVLSSPQFAASRRQRELLRYLAQHSLAGDANRLKGYAIGVEVFGRGEGFDPAADAIVRVEMGRLRGRLKDYYDATGTTDPIRFELPKGSYMLRHRPNDGSASDGGAGPAAETLPVLAVLPMDNLGGNADEDYFSDGISDALIHELSRLAGLRVISRLSSFAYRHAGKVARDIAAELGASHLLMGSVQRAGGRLRVTAQLVDARADRQLWSERLDGELQDIFTLQDELTRCIVRALQIRLAPAEARACGHDGTASIEAHDALLRGMAAFRKGAPGQVAEARWHFQRAIEHDPAYAAAHAWLAHAKLFLWILNTSTPDSLRDEALIHAQRAVELDDQLPFAVCMLGWVQHWFKRPELAILHCRRAVAMDMNNAELLCILSMVLSFAGQGDEGLYHIRRALELNPLSSPVFQLALAVAHMVREEYEPAIVAMRRGCELEPGYMPNQVLLSILYAIQGREEELRAQRNYVMALVGGDPARYLRQPWTDPALEALYVGMIRRAGFP